MTHETVYVRSAFVRECDQHTATYCASYGSLDETIRDIYALRSTREVHKNRERSLYTLTCCSRLFLVAFIYLCIYLFLQLFLILIFSAFPVL